MASEHVKEFTDANFQSEVIQSDVPVLVDFWAEWCPPCRALSPTIDKLALAYGGKVKFGKLDIDTNRNVTTQYRIENIPTLLIFKGGQLQEKIVGLKGEAALRQTIDAVQAR